MQCKNSRKIAKRNCTEPKEETNIKKFYVGTHCSWAAKIISACPVYKTSPFAAGHAVNESRNPEPACMRCLGLAYQPEDMTRKEQVLCSQALLLQGCGSDGEERGVSS